MKKIQNYIPNVLLTFLLVFALLGTELCVFAKTVVLSPATFRQVTIQEQLGEKAYASLGKTFESRSHSTGIPKEVFLETLTPDMLRDDILLHTEQAFAELGLGEARDIAADYSDMETSVRAFFEQYADENGYAKDEAYEAKVTAVIEESNQVVENAVDPFKFTTMRRNGWLEKGRQYLKYLTPAMAGCIVLTAVLLGLLVLCNRKQKLHLAYWYGLAAVVAGILGMVPCIYLKASDFFAAFALKDPQIYAAVVGMLRLLTDRALTGAIVTAVCGGLLLAVFAVLMKKQAHQN